MNMNISRDTNRWNTAKWLFAALLLVSSIAINVCCDQLALPLRVSLCIVIFLGMLMVVSRTQWGLKSIDFIKEARSELKRVVWPSREETIQATVFVVIMVVVASLCLWGLDTGFIGLITKLAGQMGGWL